MEEIKKIYPLFAIPGDLVSAESYGNGHINDTYKVSLSQGGIVTPYIIQRINQMIFKDPVQLMENIQRICSHQQFRLREESNKDVSRRVLTLIPSREGKPYVEDEQRHFWRCYLFIENIIGLNIIENENQAYMAAKAFGRYQSLLSNLPGKRLYETIPDFHNTPERYRQFQKALGKDSFNLALNVREEIDFFMAMEGSISYFTDRLSKGILPERITHNDTKINNILLDTRTGEAICIIDLDTSMPGLAAYDFGDLVRTATTFSAEDEKDLGKVHFERTMFEALLRGYLSSAVSFLTKAEIESLVWGGIQMTYEVGLRFLTDFLEGDIYFKKQFKNHNLIRCRTQIALAKELLKEQIPLEELTREIYSEALDRSSR
ncbi:MAG: aminoglycoside phosphotransferase family protein [Spirochaetaceae bacterium]|nr:aminoglycoside phosphotransferase family protein [Spirochaetaceae bacterium]